MENLDLLSLLQAGGIPAFAVIGYLLYRLNQQLTELKVSIDTLIETLIRFVPGIKENGR